MRDALAASDVAAEEGLVIGRLGWAEEDDGLTDSFGGTVLENALRPVVPGLDDAI